MNQLIERAGLLLIAATAVVAAIIGILSVWDIISGSMWWQGLLTLGIVMITVWTLIGSMRYRATPEARVTAEAIWACVGIAIVAFVSFAGLQYGSGQFVDYDSGYNDGFDAGYQSGLLDTGTAE